MSNKPVKHHVTPNSYLSNFGSLELGEKSPRISVLNRSTGETEHRVKTKDIFYKHFYDHLSSEGELYSSAEKPLNVEIEEPGSRAIDTLLEGQALSYAQTRHLARYLLVSVFRSLWFHICLRATLVEHSKRHGYSEEHVSELTHRKQVELLRALMGLPTDSPNVYTGDPVLSKLFNSVSTSATKGSKWMPQTYVATYLHRRELTIYTAPEGTEFITGDNYVVPLPNEGMENYLEIPFHNSTELLMPLSSNKFLFTSGKNSDHRGVRISRKPLHVKEVKYLNDAICTFASAHIFSKNETLLKEVQSRSPFFNGKIVEVGGRKYSYFPYSSDFPQKFRP